VYQGAVEVEGEDKMAVVLWELGDGGKATVKVR